MVENVIARIMTKVRAKCAITGIGMRSLSSARRTGRKKPVLDAPAHVPLDRLWLRASGDGVHSTAEYKEKVHANPSEMGHDGHALSMPAENEQDRNGAENVDGLVPHTRF